MVRVKEWLKNFGIAFIYIMGIPVIALVIIFWIIPNTIIDDMRDRHNDR